MPRSKPLVTSPSRVASTGAAPRGGTRYTMRTYKRQLQVRPSERPGWQMALQVITQTNLGRLYVSCLLVVVSIVTIFNLKGNYNVTNRTAPNQPTERRAMGALVGSPLSAGHVPAGSASHAQGPTQKPERARLLTRGTGEGDDEGQPSKHRAGVEARA